MTDRDRELGMWLWDTAEDQLVIRGKVSVFRLQAGPICHTELRLYSRAMYKLHVIDYKATEPFSVSSPKTIQFGAIEKKAGADISATRNLTNEIMGWDWMSGHETRPIAVCKYEDDSFKEELSAHSVSILLHLYRIHGALEYCQERVVAGLFERRLNGLFEKSKKAWKTAIQTLQELE